MIYTMIYRFVYFLLPISVHFPVYFVDRYCLSPAHLYLVPDMAAVQTEYSYIFNFEKVSQCFVSS